jgi:hypothetical protein
VALTGFELTQHALDAIAEREIELSWVEFVLRNPQRIERDRSDPDLVHALASIPECDDRVLRVVYNASTKPARIVTCYFDRRQRGKQ